MMKHMGWRRRPMPVLLVALAGAFAPGQSFAEGGPTDEPESFLVEVKEDLAIPRGKLAWLQGTATASGGLLKVPNLSVDQAVEVVLLTDDPAVPVTMELRKFHWAAPQRRATTDSEGRCSEQFRTQGDLFIKVLSAGGDQPYRLLVWVDEHSPPPMSPVLVPNNASR